MKKKDYRIRILLFVIIFIVSFVGSIKIINRLNYIPDNTMFLRQIINDSGFYEKNKGFSYHIVKFILDFNFSSVDKLFLNNYKDITMDTASDENLENVNSSYIEDPYPEKIVFDPVVYIYNTHQLEEYAAVNGDYKLVPNVMMASYILREKLYVNKINAIVEDNNVSEFLHANNWNYASSYKVTKLLMEDAYDKNPTLKYFIDIHRDSVSKNISTATINGKKYAKVMFVVGLENKNYSANLAFVEELNNMLEEKYPGISRGIYKKQGAGVNGVYNQDFNSKTILIEVGGVENEINEVLNTTIAISEILTSYIKGEDYEKENIY